MQLNAFVPKKNGKHMKINLDQLNDKIKEMREKVITKASEDEPKEKSENVDGIDHK